MKDYFLWLAKLVTTLVALLLFITVTIQTIFTASTAQLHRAEKSSKKKVGVVEITGIIENSKEVLEKLHKHIEDDSIKGIVLRINSPGGAVGPSQAIYSAVSTLKTKKPIIAAMGALAASGGLYSALGATKVLCQPGTLTGSIGVIMQIPNFQSIAQKVGFKMITIKSGNLKDAGNSFEVMPPEVKTYLEDTAAGAHEDFIQAVADGRSLDINAVRKFADGRIILGTKAMQLKLVDGFGDVYAAGRLVFEELGEPLEEGEYPELVYPDEKFKELKKLFTTLTGGVEEAFGSHMRLMYLMQ